MEKLDSLIETPDLTWRDILLEVLKGMDPWNIDLGEVASEYAGKVKQMKEMNFRIPANVVLVTSVLLRMKADLMNQKETDPFVVCAESIQFLFANPYEEYQMMQAAGIDPDVPLLVKPQRVLKRRVTAMELIEAIQKALEERQAKKGRIRESLTENGERILVIETRMNIKEAIEELHIRVLELLINREYAFFSEVAKTKEDVISYFIPLLHLSHQQRLTLSQEKIYDEILIRQVANPEK
ncbi:Segregation and condensation protein A [uncultured archaeon]|nr:Segregation and condensation protein A [uncultured archaeon]